ncbi:MAG: HVO_2753 family zinc finger protein [Methanotrichaceae archaeon]
MAEILNKCISCGITLVGSGGVTFPCPNCGEIISRCNKCRKQSNSYKCPNCEFEGP